MEITKNKVTELFCIIDEFCKHFEAENGGKLLLLPWQLSKILEN